MIDLDPKAAAVMTSFNLSTVGYAGIAGEANHGLARGGSPAPTILWSLGDTPLEASSLDTDASG